MLLSSDVGPGASKPLLYVLQHLDRQRFISVLLALAMHVPAVVPKKLRGIKQLRRRRRRTTVDGLLRVVARYLIVYGNVLYTVVMLVIPLATLTVLNVRLMAALKDVHQKRRQMLNAGDEQRLTS